MENQKIYSALCAAMSEIGAIGKEQKNQQQGFMYRGVDAVMNALQPVLIKNRIFVLPEVLEQTREERTTSRGGSLLYSILKMKYTFCAEDGSSVSAVVIGEGMDSGDKASNKAMSVAFKYACFQVLCIPTEEMQDPDADTPDPSTKAKPKPQKQQEQHSEPACTANEVNALHNEILRVGGTEEEWIEFIGKQVKSGPKPQKLEDLNKKQFLWSMEILSKRPPKADETA